MRPIQSIWCTLTFLQEHGADTLTPSRCLCFVCSWSVKPRFAAEVIICLFACVCLSKDEMLPHINFKQPAVSSDSICIAVCYSYCCSQFQLPLTMLLIPCIFCKIQIMLTLCATCLLHLLCTFEPFWTFFPEVNHARPWSERVSLLLTSILICVCFSHALLVRYFLTWFVTISTWQKGTILAWSTQIITKWGWVRTCLCSQWNLEMSRELEQLPFVLPVEEQGDCGRLLSRDEASSDKCLLSL